MIKKKMRIIFSFCIVSLLFISCGNNEQETEVTGIEKRYTATGNIVLIEIDKKRVQIRHDDIEGFMLGMTMWFAVKDDEVLKQLQGMLRGQRVKFELVKVSIYPSYISAISKIDSSLR